MTIPAWTTHTPHANTKIAYVSNTPNGTPQFYDYNHDDVGPDPFNPTANIAPYTTIAAAYAQLRTGQADWMLLKRGDSFGTNLNLTKNGIDLANKQIIGAYGTGARPRWIDTAPGITAFVANLYFFTNASISRSFIAIRDIDFYSPEGVEGDPSFNPTGTNRRNGIGHHGKVHGVLIENCRFRGFGSAIPTEKFYGKSSDWTVRGCVIFKNFPKPGGGHAQGFFAAGIDNLLVEDCVFVMNGWLKGHVFGTIYNHNMYSSSCDDQVVRRCVSLESSNLSFKTRNDPGASGPPVTVTWDNNFLARMASGGDLYVENGAPGPVFTDVLFQNCVWTECEIYSHWDADLCINENICFEGVPGHQVNNSNSPAQSSMIVSGGLWQNNLFTNTQPAHPGAIRDWNGGNSGLNVPLTENVTIQNNRIWNYTAEPGFLFQGSSPTLIDNEVNLTPNTYPDPDRTLDEYAVSVGAADYDEFRANMALQEKGAWNDAYSADTINDWFRAGFVLAGAEGQITVASGIPPQSFVEEPDIFIEGLISPPGVIGPQSAVGQPTITVPAPVTFAGNAAGTLDPIATLTLVETGTILAMSDDDAIFPVGVVS